MQTGDIVIIAFPFADLVSFKARPAVVVTQTPDTFQDVIVCFITSVQPAFDHSLHIPLLPSSLNNLKVPSTIKIYRVATIEADKIQRSIGKLSPDELQLFKEKFRELV